MSSGSPRLQNAIACPGEMACYSVGNHGTITASIGDRAFLPQSSDTSGDLFGVTCVGEHICVAVGNKGTVAARKNA